MLVASPTIEPVKTRIGIEPVRAETKQRDAVTPPAQVPSIKDAPTRPSGLQAVSSPPPKKEKERAPSAAAAASQHMPAARRPSSAPIIIGILVALAAIGGAVWWFVLRPPADETVATTPKPGSDQATKPPDNGSNGSARVVDDTGSNGSAIPANGSNGSNGSAVPETGSNGSNVGSNGSAAPAKVDLVDTVIASNIAKSTVEVVGTPQSGPAPFIAKLEKGKAYKVAISAPRYATKTLDVKAGDPQVLAKLDPKPSTIHVDSDPPGALIFVDNASTTVKTPGDVTLTAAQAARKTIHVSVRMAGKKPFDQIVDTSTLTESADKITGSVDAGKLAVQVIVQRPPPPPPDHTGSGSGAGSDATPTNGSNAPPDKTGSAAPPPPPPTNGSGGEPEPDWTKKN
jgi:hypothetical protein